MSKGSLFWANASGKLGEAVFYRAGGEQRNRSYVKKIKNPKTLAQAEQRLSMLNFSAGFRLLAPLLRVSFVNRPSNLSGFNAFVKANKNLEMPVIDKTISDKGLAVLGQAVLSQGNLVVGSGMRVERDFFTDGEVESAPSRDGIGYTLETSRDSYVEGGASRQDWIDFVGQYGSSDVMPLTMQQKAGTLFSLMGLSQNAVMNVVVASYDDDGYSYKIYTKRAADTLDFSDIDFGTLVLKSLDVTELDSVPFSAFVGFDVPAAENDENYVAIIFSDKVGDATDITTTRLMTNASNPEYTKQFQQGGAVYEQIMAAYGPAQSSVIEA